MPLHFLVLLHLFYTYLSRFFCLSFYLASFIYRKSFVIPVIFPFISPFIGFFLTIPFLFLSVTFYIVGYEERTMKEKNGNGVSERSEGMKHAFFLSSFLCSPFTFNFNKNIWLNFLVHHYNCWLFIVVLHILLLTFFSLFISYTILIFIEFISRK